METKIESKGKARFDTRLTREQKEYFEFVAQLGGFRSLTDFMIVSAQEKAKQIEEEHNTFLASEKDREVFFDTILNSEEPNEPLRKASERYLQALEGK
jgi:uncharacterized protein (DUF1778 family)